jgi:hypothetical protein
MTKTRRIGFVDEEGSDIHDVFDTLRHLHCKTVQVVHFKDEGVNWLAFGCSPLTSKKALEAFKREYRKHTFG